MKQLLITIAAVVLVGCGPSIDIHDAARHGDIDRLKSILDSGTDINIKDAELNSTPLDYAIDQSAEVTNLLRKHGAKTGEELKAEGK